MINEKSTIAIPYYGSLVRPGRGLENIYIKADFDPSSGQMENVCVQVWDQRSEGRLHKWLSSLGVSGVFCRDRNSRYEDLLSQEGIWVEDHNEDNFMGSGLA